MLILCHVSCNVFFLGYGSKKCLRGTRNPKHISLAYVDRNGFVVTDDGGVSLVIKRPLWITVSFKRKF